MFRSNFYKLLDKATSHLLMEPDWKATLEMTDLIRQKDIQPKNALTAIKKRIQSPNQYSAMFAVQVLESIVKNCGPLILDEITTPAFAEDLHGIVKNTEHAQVADKLLELMQAWTFAFRKNPKIGPLKDTVAVMKAEGYNFPAVQETDAMFSADSAPAWVDGENCHRCRAQFTTFLRRHHCRACGQTFCGACSSKESTIPKYGIEKEVRVCDTCYDNINKPSTTVSKDPDMEEYLKSSLAQQSQAPPPRKSEAQIREEEELALALALSQSEAEAKEQQKMNFTSAYSRESSNIKIEPTVAHEDSLDNSELARYLNRSYWENRPNENNHSGTTIAPSAPAPASSISSTPDLKVAENGVVDVEIEDFMSTLRSQVEIFINRMKSNSSRGRSIANDSSVQTLFMNITAMHSKLLNYIQQHDDSRLHYERLQDKMAQVKDARAALDALREEHKEKLRREAEEAERQRQMLMAQKLDIMRKKKQEYLQYQRQVALQRIQEQTREMHMRQEQQKQQYMLGSSNYYMGSPAHAPQFVPGPAGPLPQAAPSGQQFVNYAYPPPQMPQQRKALQLGGPGYNMGATGGPPIRSDYNGQPIIGGGMPMMSQMAPMQHPAPSGMMAPQPQGPPPGPQGYPQGPPQAHPVPNPAPGAPPASPQVAKQDVTTEELIKFD